MNIINKLLKNLNESPYFFGIMMILLNIGSKYVSNELSKNQDKFLNTKIMRRIAIFTMAFIATKDIITSLVITAVFIILVFGLFNEDSSFCILPKFLKQFDTNKDGKLSSEELNNAIKIIKKSGLYKIDKN